MPIVAGVDQSSRAESVVAHGRKLAATYNVELHVVHVGSLEVGHTGTEQARQEAEEIALEVVEDLGDQITYEPIGLVGEPAEQLLEYGDSHDAEFIVISARKRTGLDQAIFGGVSQSLLLNADRPVVAVP